MVWEIGKVVILCLVVLWSLIGTFLVWKEGKGESLFVLVFYFFVFIVVHSWLYPREEITSLTERSGSYSLSSSTFSSGVTPNGNSSPKAVTDAPQVEDSSGMAGFGNGGISGHDSASTTLTYECGLTAQYFSHNNGGNGIFEMCEGDTADVVAGDDITIDFRLPTDSGAVYYVNGIEIEGQPAASEVNVTWIRFTAEWPASVVKVVYNYVNYTYTFNSL